MGSTDKIWPTRGTRAANTIEQGHLLPPGRTETRRRRIGLDETGAAELGKRKTPPERAKKRGEKDLAGFKSGEEGE